MQNLFNAKKRMATLSVLMLSGAMLSGCSDSGGGASSYTISGTISGLTQPLTIALNSETIKITVDGPFSFSSPQSDAASFSVTASSSIHQTCDVSNGSGTVSGSDISNVAISCRKIAYFAGTDATHGSELWRTDGTEAGTYMLKDINVGSLSSAPLNMTALGEMIYFVANDGTNGYELWKSDGTEAGTVAIQETVLSLSTPNT